VDEASLPAAVGADSAAAAAGTLRNTHIHLAASVLAVLATVAALYLARAFFVPLLIGILASYTLHPLVDGLAAWRVPRGIGAALVLALVVGGFSWIGFSISDDAVALIEKLPEAARKLRKDLSASRAGAPSALQNMQDATNELQGAAADAGAKPAPPGNPRARAFAGQAPEPTWLRDYTLAQTALLVTVAAQTPIVLLLSYFLLASGAHFRRKLVHLVGPSLSRKKEAVRILEEIDTQVQRYLLTMLASNALLAVCSWLVFLGLGLDQAGVWGVAAGVLHFIPYLGPTLIALGTGVAAFLQSGSLLFALTVALASLIIAGSIGFIFMTWLQSRFARVNAAVLFIALLFFGWLWGVWGLLLGAPIVAISKVVCDRVESLKPAGELLGR
jgi:predicted PurR-regulated permease PerM